MLTPPRALALALLLLGFPTTQAHAQLPPIQSHREQAEVMRGFLERRFERLPPELMRRHGIDMWILVTREYNDDPVFRSMAPLTTYASRRRTILVFHDRGPTLGVERLSIGRFDYEQLYTVVPTHNDGQWAGLRALLDQRRPKVLAINTSRTFAHADGLSHSEHQALVEAIGPVHAARLTSAEPLAVDWLERKLPEETAAYRQAMAIAHAVIAEAFSAAVVTPGVTTADDLAWWMRQGWPTSGSGSGFSRRSTSSGRADSRPTAGSSGGAGGCRTSC